LQGAGREQTAGWYCQALDILLALQHPQNVAPRAGCIAFRLAFDVEKLMWELDFFLTHMIKQLCAQRLTPVDEATLRGQFWKLAAMLARPPRVLTHRDYHSRNLMLHHGKLYIIDFQDALIGPAAYDVASLGQDARVTIDPEFEARIVEAYMRARMAAGAFDREAFERDYAIMAAQRMTKVIGIFVRLKKRDGKAGYLRHLPRLAAYLKRSLAHPALAPVAQCYAELGIPMEDTA
jgi:aminoglycoside/choline kinase family phosphotransferase